MAARAPPRSAAVQRAAVQPLRGATPGRRLHCLWPCRWNDLSVLLKTNAEADSRLGWVIEMWGTPPPP